MAPVGHVARRLGEGGEPGCVVESLQALGLETLVTQQQGGADRMPRRHLVRDGRRHDQLHQVDPERSRAAQDVGGARAAVEVALRVVGVHAAIAVDRDAQRQVVAQHVVVAGLRHAEPVAVALDAAVQRRQAGAAALGVAPGTEEFEAEVEARARPDHAGGIGGSAERILRQGGGRAAHALGLEAVAVREVAVGGECGQGRQGGRERGQAQCAGEYLHRSVSVLVVVVVVGCWVTSGPAAALRAAGSPIRAAGGRPAPCRSRRARRSASRAAGR